MTKLALFAIAGAIAFSAQAQALEVQKRREAPGIAEEVWKLVGGFCDIKSWHPAVADCVEAKEGDVVYRTLTLKNGGKIKEKLTQVEPTSYSYEIVEGPLPVKNYKATLKVGPDDEENRVEILWSATFDAEGASDADAQKVIAGIFNDGVSGIKKTALEHSDKKDAADDKDDVDDKDDDKN
jgi:hypothetical protein